jgi:hypothetical protein
VLPQDAARPAAQGERLRELPRAGLTTRAGVGEAEAEEVADVRAADQSEPVAQLGVRRIQRGKCGVVRNEVDGVVDLRVRGLQPAQHLARQGGAHPRVIGKTDAPRPLPAGRRLADVVQQRDEA